MISYEAAQRLALPAGERDERTLFYRNQLQATQSALERADSHHLLRRTVPGFGARCVGRCVCFAMLIALQAMS